MKEHNVSALTCHIVCPAKRRGAEITEGADKRPREIRLGIEARYEINFLEIGAERGRAHFLAQSAPTYSPERTARAIKGVTARKTCERRPEVKNMLWGGEFWTRGYYAGGAGERGDRQAMRR
ncbi:MAG: IS200/IS605 family transposase [Treponema sp.]|nr:IS200/IS605 family transposase [Treponema sp.]